MFDSSAKLLNPSLTFTTHHSGGSGYRDIDANSYFSPFDRIGRLYSVNASGLTMKEAGKLAKLMGGNDKRSTPKVIGVNLSATAPAAFDATVHITDLARTGKGSPSKRKAGLGGDKLRSWQATASPDAIREHHRMIRSKPGYTTMQVRDTQFFEEKQQRDFDDWNPACLDDPEEDEHAGVAAEELNVKKFEAKRNSFENFVHAIEHVAEHGVVTATGSGNRLPVPGIKPYSLESIIARVPSIPGFLEDDHMRYCLGVEIVGVKDGYVMAASRASVEYSIMDPTEAAQMGIISKDLYDESSIELWTNKIYQMPEWRIYRHTGVDAKAILYNFHRMDRNLCNTLTIMLDLQYLWMEGTLPTSAWEEQLPFMQQRCNYAQFLFVDVAQQKFRTKLPFLIEDFAHHVENVAKEVRDALMDYWIAAASGKLSTYISQLPEYMHALLDDVDREEHEALELTGFGEPLHGDGSEYGGGDYPDDISMDSARKNNKAKKNPLRARAALEGLTGKKATGAAGAAHPRSSRSTPRGGAAGGIIKDHGSKRRYNKAEKVLDSAVVLMSRQLRTMCENSLTAMADLFEDLSKPVTAEYSIFTLNVRLRKQRTRRSRRTSLSHWRCAYSLAWRISACDDKLPADHCKRQPRLRPP